VLGVAGGGGGGGRAGGWWRWVKPHSSTSVPALFWQSLPLLLFHPFRRVACWTVFLLTWVHLENLLMLEWETRTTPNFGSGVGGGGGGGGGSGGGGGGGGGGGKHHVSPVMPHTGGVPHRQGHSYYLPHHPMHYAPSEPSFFKSRMASYDATSNLRIFTEVIYCHLRICPFS
jgi:hypothetical protein